MQRAFRTQGREFVKGFAGYAGRFPAEAKEARLSEALEDWELEALLRASETATQRGFILPIDRAARKALLAGALHAIADVGVELSFALKNPRAVAWLQDYGASRVTLINEATREYIKSVVVQGVQEGWSYDRMARAITERYSEFAVGRPQEHIKSRAHLVSITECGDAYCEANRIIGEELQNAGVETEKRWSTIADDRVSNGCQANADAGWIPFGQPFPSGHQRPLRFPGCRCDLLTRRKVS